MKFSTVVWFFIAFFFVSVKLIKLVEQKKLHDYDIRVVAKLVEKRYHDNLRGKFVVLYNDKEYSTIVGKSEYRSKRVGDEIEVRYNTKLEEIDIDYKGQYYLFVSFMIFLVFYFIICLISPPEDVITRAKRSLNR